MYIGGARSLSATTYLLPSLVQAPGNEKVYYETANRRTAKLCYSIYTFKALMVLPEAMASHSPARVICPVFMVMPCIGGDQAKFVI